MTPEVRAVLFDWRGTLAVTCGEEEWVATALHRLDRSADDQRTAELAAALRDAADELDGPGVDADAALHRSTYSGVFRRLGVDDDLAAALYAVESDLRIAVVSDVHVDIRPAFARAGLADLVDVFTLSVELGVQKPDARMFTRTLDALGVAPAEALMVGDRSRPDGAAVEVGIPTLLVPPLYGTHDRRLHRVLALCGLR